MKSSFFEFEESEQPIQEVWDASQTIFVLDTNIFLNLYVFHESSRQKIYKAWDKIKERLWSPHQVMLEFHRNRERHIEKNKNYFQNDFIDDFLKQFTEPYIKLQNLKNKYGKNYSDLGVLIDTFTENADKELSEDFKRIHETIKEKLSPIKKKLEDLQSQLITSKDQDSLYQKLCELYPDDKVGKAFTQLELDELYKEGEQRFQHNVPPGYKDKGKLESYHHRGVVYHSKFGDFILYKQILTHCKANQIKNVIFVSEDNKEDWIDKNTKTVRKEIMGEAFSFAGIQHFVMMRLQLFLEYGKVNLDQQLKQDFQVNPYEGLIQVYDLESIGTDVFNVYFNKKIDTVYKYRILYALVPENSNMSIVDYNEIQESLNIEQGVLITYKVVTKSVLKDKSRLINVEGEFKRIINDDNTDAEVKMNLLLYICGIDNKVDINSYLFGIYPTRILNGLQNKEYKQVYQCAIQCYNEKNQNNKLNFDTDF